MNTSRKRRWASAGRQLDRVSLQTLRPSGGAAASGISDATSRGTQVIAHSGRRCRAREGEQRVAPRAGGLERHVLAAS